MFVTDETLFTWDEVLISEYLENVYHYGKSMLTFY